MVKQILLPLLGVAIFITIVGLFVQKSGSINFSETLNPSASASPSTKYVTISGKIIDVEIANNQALRNKGLSGRTALGVNSGMLFVFESKSVNASFWMKDMLIPLDLIWIENGNVIRIDKNIKPPAPGTSDSQLSVYTISTPIDYVLEVNAGFTDQNNIKVGDSVALPIL